MSKWTCVRTGDDELHHFGIKGMKWGVRRYQNKDGSLTPAGKKRYDDSDENEEKQEKTKSNKKEKRKGKGKAAAAVITTAALTTAAVTNKDNIKKGMESLKTKKTSDGEKKESTVEDYKNAAKKAESTKKVLDGVKEIANRAENKAYEKKIRTEVSQMTDKELQQAVNRLNMEERYSQVMQQRHKLEQGESKVNQVLDLAGDAVAGAVTALTILAAIKELTKK